MRDKGKFIHSCENGGKFILCSIVVTLLENANEYRYS